ncbi:MAG: dihydrolipoyl dehydrogenase [Candidatus Omnitrophota bacterium]
MYELVIIGAGWAGFNAAIKAKELGLKTILIEKSRIGGTCLNHGCIPTKALIQSAKVLHTIRKSSDFGIKTESAQPDFIKIQERKDLLIRQLASGMNFMLKGIDYLQAEAQIVSAQLVLAGEKEIPARAILIASGSYPAELSNIKFDHRRIISSDEILEYKSIPRDLLIIGAGAVGCEFASFFSSMGSAVTIAEKMPQLLPGFDQELSRRLLLIFKKAGIQVELGADAASLLSRPYELVLLCVGRSPVIKGLGLEGLSIGCQGKAIVTDDYLRTKIPGIFAAGDCTAKIMLAHFAAYQGSLAAMNIAYPDSMKPVDPMAVPGCVFTDPEIAYVGIGEEEARAKGIGIKVHRFDFLSSAMARILDETGGFIKIIEDTGCAKILGASIIGPRATELIGILSLAVESGLSVNQVKQAIFAHPTLSEGIGEALR